MSASRWSRIAATALVPLTLAGCAGVRSCTSAACGSGVYVDLASLRSRPALWGSTARLCVDAVCQDQAVTGTTDRIEFIRIDLGVNTTPPSSIPTDAPVTVTLTLLTGTTEALRATTTTTLSRMAPNGEACGPICYSAELRLTGSALVPVA